MSCCVINHDGCHDCCVCDEFPLTCDLCDNKAAIDLRGGLFCGDHDPSERAE